MLPSGFFLAVLSVLFLIKHDAETKWFSVGCVANFCLSVVLKKTVNQSRPVGAPKSGPGMPSAHANMVFFAATFTILSMARSRGIDAYTVVFGVLAMALASYISWLRISNKYHTKSQVSVGAMLGVVSACFWFKGLVWISVQSYQCLIFRSVYLHGRVYRILVVICFVPCCQKILRAQIGIVDVNEKTLPCR